MDKARFDTKLPVDQKQYFERAATLGGYRSLTDFMLSSAQEKAEEIIRKEETVLASERDAEIFFEAINANTKPNKALKDLVKSVNGL
tara:strand:- start:137 stop:397 length:261 start_codon:yes stop_codon:yes gene_type:complete